MATSAYSTQDLDLLLEIQVAAEVRLAAQLTAALAADQRAMVFAGFAATAAAALAGGAATALTSISGSPGVAWVAVGAAVGLLIAMAMAITAGWVSQWYYPGGSPSSWLSDIASHTDRASRLVALVEDYDDRIRANAALMKRNGQWMHAAGVVTLITVLAAVASLVWIYWDKLI